MKLIDFWRPLIVLSAAAASPGALAADPQVDLKTNVGTIRIELYPAKAPKTVENFLQYVKDGHYNGTIFHRVIDGFMIQGGGFDKNMQAEADARADRRTKPKNGLKNDLGTLAMARTSAPHSASAQFFINVKNNDFLNSANAQDGWGYAVFGKVVSGMDVVMKIAKVADRPGRAPTGDVPREAVVIESADPGRPTRSDVSQALFISDLHLSGERPETNQQFFRFLDERGAAAPRPSTCSATCSSTGSATTNCGMPPATRWPPRSRRAFAGSPTPA